MTLKYFLKHYCLFLLIVSTIPFVCFAGETQPDETLPGFKFNNVFESRGIDHINPFNGAVSIVVPLGPEYPLGPSNSWQLNAYYNSKFWKMDSKCWAVNGLPGEGEIHHANVLGYPTLGAGWTLELGFVHVGKDVDAPMSGPFQNDWGVYVSPDGGRHLFEAPAAQTTYLPTDNSRIRITKIANGYKVWFPDGTIHTFTQKYKRPKPNYGDSFDFTDVHWDALHNIPPESYRYGLTAVHDNFGIELLTVTYLFPNNPDHLDAWRVGSINLVQQNKTISYEWQTVQVQETAEQVEWDVLKSISLPGTNGKTLKVTFSYLTDGFPRSSYDNSNNVSNPPPECRNRWDEDAPVPLLDRLTFTDPFDGSFGSPEYQFSYLLPPADSDDRFYGTLKSITTPNQGTVSYVYDQTSGNPCRHDQGCEDPETGTFITQPPLGVPPCGNTVPGGGGVVLRRRKYLDKSAAVVQRTETDPFTNITSIVTYDREDSGPAMINPEASCSVFDDLRLARRVIVKEPSGNGIGQFATRYVFHVAAEEGDDVAGIELARRIYQDANEFGTPIRSTISCHISHDQAASEGSPGCGYRSDSGVVGDQSWLYSPFVFPAGNITWYGASPTGGYNCPNGATFCSKAMPSSYDDVARKYEVETLSTNLPGMPGWIKRINTTAWAPVVDSSHWLLDLFTYKSVLDADDAGFPNPNVPAPNATTTNFQFNTNNGFLQRKWTYGNGSDALTADYSPDGLGNPQIETLSGSGAGLADFFTNTRTFQTGLSTSTQRSGITWRSFDVTRDPATGLITFSRDPNASLQTSYTYDVLGRLTSITPPDGESLTTVCYEFSNTTTPALTLVKKGSGTACSKNDGIPGLGSGSFEGYQYDGFGRLLRKIRRLPNPLSGGSYFAKQETRYDSAGHQVYLSEWNACSINGYPATDINNCLHPIPAPSLSGSGGTQWSNFDPFGRAITITKPDSKVITTEYTDDGTLSGQSFAPILFSDTLQKVTVSVSGQNAVTWTRKDILGRIIAVREPQVDGATDDTTYKYNVLDKLAKVEQGQTRTFTYDPIGFLRQENTPEKGIVNYTSYDALGNPKVAKEANDTLVITQVYDQAGRLTKISTNEGGGRTYVTNTYDGIASCPPGAGTINYVKGKLTSRVAKNDSAMVGANVSDIYSYCGRGGRISHQATTAHTLPTVTQKWHYNTLGLIANHYHPRQSGLFVVSTEYASGIATSLRTNGLPAVSGITYHPSGMLKSYSTGNNTDKNVTTSIDIDVVSRMARPREIYATRQGITLPIFTTGVYSYDGAGNITSIGSDIYSYDGRSRLTNASLIGFPTQVLDHDRWNNLTQKGAQIFTHNTNNQLTGNNAAYVRGNLTAYGTETYIYDGLNRMHNYRANSTSPIFRYLYDGSNERIVKAPTTGVWTYTFRDETNHVATEFAGTNISRDNVYLGNLLVASYEICSADPNNCRINSANVAPWQYYVSDHLGSPRLVTDPSGSIVDGRKYWPFGEPVNSENFLQPTRFASMERDTESSRYYDHARSEDFNLGRFLSPDNLQGQVSRPSSWNRYTYTSNNPINRVDTNGMEEELPPLRKSAQESMEKAKKAAIEVVIPDLALGSRTPVGFVGIDDDGRFRFSPLGGRLVKQIVKKVPGRAVSGGVGLFLLVVDLQKSIEAVAHATASGVKNLVQDARELQSGLQVIKPNLQLLPNILKEDSAEEEDEERMNELNSESSSQQFPPTPFCGNPPCPN